MLISAPIRILALAFICAGAAMVAPPAKPAAASKAEPISNSANPIGRSYEPKIVPLIWKASLPLLREMKTRETTANAKSYSKIMGLVAHGTYNLWDVVSTCYNVDTGERGVPSECIESILTTVLSYGFIVARRGDTGSWWKRDIDTADAILSRIPDHVKVTDIKIYGAAMNNNSSRNSLNRRDKHAHEDPIDIEYKGILPITFIMHHDHRTTSKTATHLQPMFIATDGLRTEIGHVQYPGFDHLTAANKTLAANKRSTANKATHLPAENAMPHKRSHSDMGFMRPTTGGGIKVQSLDGGFTTSTNLMNWLGMHQKGGMFSIIQYMARDATFMSFYRQTSDTGAIYGNYGYWAMEAEVKGFGSKWEDNWNWCFGPRPSKCNR